MQKNETCKNVTFSLKKSIKKLLMLIVGQTFVTAATKRSVNHVCTVNSRVNFFQIFLQIFALYVLI